MHAIEAILGRPEVERLGWVLLHFVWQGIVGAGLLAGLLFAMRRASANARYLASCVTLAAMAACLPVTWLLLPQRSLPVRIKAPVADLSPAMQNTPIDHVIASADHFAPEISTLPPTDAVVAPPRIDGPAAYQPVAASAQLSWSERLAIGLPWFAAVWLAGVLVLSIRLAVGWTTVHRLRRAASRTIDDDKQMAMSRLARRLGIRWPVKLLESALVEVPTMIGWLRPAILWPPSMLTGLSVDQFESLLAHELAHIRRHDYLLNLIQTAIETLLFYHPAVWWVSSRIRHERECCCDDLAVAVCGNRLSYARALAVVEELRPRPRQFALAADGGRLLTRVRRIVGAPMPNPRSGRHWMLGVSFSLILSVVVVAVGISSFATGDEPPSKNAEPKSPVQPADTAKATEPAKSQTAKVRMPYDISVQKLGNSDWDNLLPEKLADHIRQLPHVTRVVPTLFSDSPFAYGVPPDFPATFSKQKLISGRLPSAGDRRKVIVGKTLAEKAGYKVGDEIKLFDQKVEVIGILESPFDPLNFSTQLPLAELQEIMHAEHGLNELLVNVDIPQDGSVDHERQFAELRAGIAKLGDAESSELSIIEVNKPPKPAHDAAWVPSSSDKDAIELSGQVVDDQTGKPIPFFHRQGGQAFTFNIQWGLSEWWDDSSEGEGRFTVPINWRGGWRARIVAGGYLPERILTKSPDPTKSSIEGIVVRMKRGRTVSGRLVDHSGKPVAGASLFVIGPLNSSTRLRISEGKAFVGNNDQWVEDVSIPPFKTDANGRFTVTGVGWDARFIAVSCSALDFWVASAPSESQSRDFEIRLPQPAKLVVDYDIPGAADEVEVALWPENKQIYLGTPGPEGPGTFISVDSGGRPLDWTSNVFYNRIGTAKQHGELVIDNLPAGEYVIQRVKEFETVLGVNGKVGLDRRVVKLAAGTTTAVDWVRKTGAAVTGQIVGLENTRIRGLTPARLFVTVEPAVQPNPTQAIDYSYVDIIHKDNESREAKFKTEQLPPGKYRIVAKVFEDSSSRLATLDRDPQFIGETNVEVTENGSPPPVTIEVQKFVKVAKPAPKVNRPTTAPAPSQPAQPAALIRILSGHAVDAETGQPVQGFVYDLAKFDEQDPARFHWNGEAIGPGSQKDGEFGIIVKNQIGRPVWARIVAPGYVPQPITEKPIVLAEDSVLDKFEVRMHRGKTLAGRVVDSSGNSVADAGVYLLRNQGSRQVVRVPAAGAHQQFEMLAMTDARTDADGRFKMTGWDAESGRVAVMSGAMNLWVTPIPADPADWTVHLPKPAAIECLVDNDRGELSTLYDLDFVTTGRKGWELLRAYQFNLSSKDGKLSIANHTPGQYDLVRRRRVKVAEYEGEFKLADVKLQVDPSNKFTIDLRHSVGWPIAGQIAGLKELGLSGAVISVEPPGEVKRGQMTFDATTCGEDGRFETGRLAPGKYRVHVDGYLPKVAVDLRAFRGGTELPDTARPPAFTVDVEVTITKDQQPDNFKLELKKGGESRAFREILQYHQQPHPTTIDEFTSPPWAVTAAGDNPAKNGADASDNSKGGEKADPKPTTPENKKPAETPMPEPKPIEVYGQVIDDETGKPVKVFDTQGGHVDEKDPTKVAWGYWLRPNAGGSEGRFDVNMDWNAGWRARVVASGYVPQPILTDPPKPGQDKIEGLVIRMKRGRTVSGRVVDHAGKSVKNAALFVVGSRPMDITGDQALMNSSQGTVEDRSAGRYATDADGRFTLSGIGEDAKNIAVSCRAVDLWIVPAPTTDEAAKDFEIRLPEPGKLIVHYDIPGGPDETTIFLQLHTWDREGWKGVDNRRRPTVKQHGELVLDNMTPGEYEVVRESGGFLDRRQVTIEPGKTVTSDFIRKAGAPITGNVVGLDREDVQKAKPTQINISVHKPGEERNPVAPKFAAVQISAIDKDGKPSDGSFKTEIIPPGKYLVKASVFIEETPEQRHRTGIIPPGFEGEATVTVPEQGAPPPVEIKLTKWQYKPFEIKKPADAPKEEAPKDSSKKAAGESPAARGSNRLSEPPADKGVDDAVKQGLQAIGNKPNDDEAAKATVTKGLLYLARKQAEEATAEKAPEEVVTKVDPALVAELLALDAMRAGTSTALDKVDEAGRRLLEKYQKPEEQGLIYFILLQIHGDSGLQRPNRIISYAQQALKYPLGSRHKLRVYIYWGDTLNVQKTEKPLPEQRKEAAAVYLKGLKLAWMYPETPPAVPDPPPRYDGPEGPEQSAQQKAWERYRDLRNKADFIKEVNSDRAIFIRQIADMYHRPPPAAAATPAEIDALRKQAAEILQNDAAVARLMAAINPDPDAVHFGNAALPADAPKEEAPKESPKKAAGESPAARGSNRLSEPPADKGIDDAVKQGLQAIGNKQDGDEGTKAAVTKGLLYLAQKEAKEATASEKLLNEAKITVDPALDAELRALDAMRAGTSTPFDKVDETGRKLLEKYQKPEEQGQIYYMLLLVHGQSGLVTPNHIISYAQQALKHPIGSRQEMMVYIYWGDTLNVQRTERPLPEQRKEAAAVYLKGLKLVWPYPETPPAVPDPPPLSDDPNEAERAARQKAWEHYQDLRDKADFIKEVNYHRAIFIRQIADMYHRLPAATPAEVEALRKQANEILQNNAAVARLMAAVDPDAAKKAAAEPADSSLTKTAIEALTIANAQNEEKRWSMSVAGIEARLSFQQAREVNGTRIIATYLELRNVSDSATPIEISLDPSKIEFKVIDAKGKEVKQAGLPYDGMTALPGVLRLPHDSQLRLGVSGNGAGIPKDAGALLDLASSAAWLFKPGDTGEYRLQAGFKISTKTGDQLSHGTIEVPPARIPLGK